MFESQSFASAPVEHPLIARVALLDLQTIVSSALGYGRTRPDYQQLPLVKKSCLEKTDSQAAFTKNRLPNSAAGRRERWCASRRLIDSKLLFKLSRL
jgi:hypothetical protein